MTMLLEDDDCVAYRHHHAGDDDYDRHSIHYHYVCDANQHADGNYEYGDD